MTVPEENRKKNEKTDDTITHPDTVRREQPARTRDGEGESTTMREALEDADVRPDDFEQG